MRTTANAVMTTWTGYHRSHYASNVHISGEFDDKQKKRLAQIATRCPVHKTLEKGVVFARQRHVRFSLTPSSSSLNPAEPDLVTGSRPVRNVQCEQKRTYGESPLPTRNTAAFDTTQTRPSAAGTMTAAM